MKKLLPILTSILVLYSPSLARAQSPEKLDYQIQAYKGFTNLNIPPLTTPTVVELPLSKDIYKPQLTLVDMTSQTIEPYYLKIYSTQEPVKILVISPEVNSNPNNMTDGNLNTFTQFPLEEKASGQIQLNLTTDKPITSSSLTLLVDNHVTLPTNISISTLSQGNRSTVISNQPLTGNTIKFPKTTSNTWYISLKVNQPLRINELRLNQDEIAQENTYALRFLAQPNHTYRLYFDPDHRALPTRNTPMSQLANAANITPITSNRPLKNSAYQIADSDNDGVPDPEDNCPLVTNPDQEDINANTIGDLCDDFDLDGILNSLDNCPNLPNQYQEDADSDGLGDICDQQESRLTESNPWIPWLGIGIAIVVLIVLIFLTSKHPGKPDQDPNSSDS
jgi:hypothetical protein